MNTKTTTPIETLIQSVQESAKYRNVCVELIGRLGAHELAARKNLKEAIKATKNALHQATGAYEQGKADHGKWMAELHTAAAAEDPDVLRQACRAVMEHHASTKERLPILDTLYTTIFADLPPIRSVLDIACGLNPLAIPWMPLAPGATYAACDIFTDRMAFLQEFLGLVGVAGTATARDVVSAFPSETVDLALVLKFLPVMEQSQKGSGLELLRTLKARYIVVSFPTRTLGGHGKGMEATYETWFLERVAQEDWSIRTLRFPTELCFVLSR